ncbi:glycosyltransferase family 4 protein [uncultured Methylobacterium sp.]|uniref:glycosyltransferase family 4 protein n=1 Tax=uncultured Methylobacterium sp. TaxID=157278 RepID=UPI0035CA720F
MTEPARIAIVLKGYPRLSETFIAQEILALEARGLALSIWSLRRPTDTARHPMHAMIAAPVAYLPEYLRDAPWRVLHALAWGLRRPRFPRLAAQFARDLARDPTPARLRRFGQALVLAKNLPDAVRHLHAHFLHAPASVTRYAAILTGRTWSVSAHAKDIWTTPEWELSEKLGDAAWGVACTRDGLARLRALCGSTRSPADTPAPPPGKRGSPLPGGERVASRFPWPARPRWAARRRSDIGPDHVALAYHGLDLARFPEPPADRPARDGSDAGAPMRILCVGRLVAKKGHDDLIDALALLPGLHWRLDLIGGGELRAALVARVAARGLDGRVAFLGAMAQPAVIAAMRAADLFVLPTKPAPSGDRDGLPNVLMEAASQGLPILATAFAGTPEFITDGTQGVLVPPGDTAALSAAILRLAADPGGRRRLAEAARARLVRDFPLDAGIDLVAGRLAMSAGLAAREAVPASAAGACPCGC